MNLRHVVKRKVGNTDLARAVDALVDRYGSDEKVALAMGVSDRFTVMRWRTGKAVPTEPKLVEALIRLGVSRELLAQQERLDPLAELRAEVDRLTRASDTARKAHQLLQARVAKLEKAGLPRQAKPAKRQGRTGP